MVRAKNPNPVQGLPQVLDEEVKQENPTAHINTQQEEGVRAHESNEEQDEMNDEGFQDDENDKDFVPGEESDDEDFEPDDMVDDMKHHEQVPMKNHKKVEENKTENDYNDDEEDEDEDYVPKSDQMEDVDEDFSQEEIERLVALQQQQQLKSQEQARFDYSKPTTKYYRIFTTTDDEYYGENQEEEEDEDNFSFKIHVNTEYYYKEYECLVDKMNVMHIAGPHINTETLYSMINDKLNMDDESSFLDPEAPFMFAKRSYNPYEPITSPYPHDINHFLILELSFDIGIDGNKVIMRFPCKPVNATSTIKTCFTYDPVMLAHKEDGHPEQPKRITDILTHFKKLGIMSKFMRIPSAKASKALLSLCHDPTYVEQVLNSTKDNILFENDSIYFNEHTAEAARLAAGSSLFMTDLVANRAIESGMAIIRSPGHHAEYNQARGFCFFNNVAIASKYALDSLGLKRVMIVDFDVHHGNGTQHILEDDNRALFFSSHRHSLYPRGTGNYMDIGEGNGKGYSVNIPFVASYGDAEIIESFHRILLPIAQEFKPELIFISAGFDAVDGDPLGGCYVQPKAFGYLVQQLRSVSNRIIMLLEGGYNTVESANAFGHCAESLLGNAQSLSDVLEDEEQMHPLNEKVFDYVAEELAPYWKCMQRISGRPTKRTRDDQTDDLVDVRPEKRLKFNIPERLENQSDDDYVLTLYKEGAKHFEVDNYKYAIDILKRAQAIKDHPLVLSLLGDIYIHGLYTLKNESLGVKLKKRAIELGNFDACRALAMYYKMSPELKNNEQLALDILKVGHEANNIECSQMYVEQLTFMDRLEEAEHIVNKVNHPELDYMLGKIYQSKNRFEDAYKLFSKPRDKPHVVLEMEVIDMLFTGRGVEQDPKEAWRRLQALSSQGQNSESIKAKLAMMVGKFYAVALTPDQTEPDVAKAFSNFKMALRYGESDALYHMCMLLFNEEHREALLALPDFDKDEELLGFRRSILNHFVEFEDNGNKIYDIAKLVRNNTTLFFNLLKEAINHGCLEALNELGGDAPQHE